MRGREKSKISQNILPYSRPPKKNESNLKKELIKHHPYDVPEVAKINVSSMNKPYLNWLIDSTN